jgi:UDP-N-acetylglucosamine 1-carboxyvinyltransferase
LKALECLGAEIELAAGYVKASAPKGRLSGGDFSFPGRVGRRDRERADGGGDGHGPLAIVQRGARARDRRPVQLLVAMGAKISGIGSSHLVIDGVEGLHGHDYEVMPDRIEAGSYALRGRDHRRLDRTVGARPDICAPLNALCNAG